MATTYQLISSYTVSGSSTAQFTFSSIPSTYDHLILNISSSANYGGGYHLNNILQTNTQTNEANYTGRFAYTTPGNPNTISTQGSTPTCIWIGGANSNTSTFFSNNWTFIGNYKSASAPSVRPYFGGNQPTSSSLIVFGSARPGTAEATTTLTFRELSNNNYVAGSTFYLYGISNT